MLLVLGRLTINPDVIDDYEADLTKMIPKVLTEDGCRYYSLVIENKDKGIVSVSELWDDEAALLKHFTQPWIVDFVTKFGAQIQASTLKVFDASNERDLPGG